jgi:hypothetical protein
MVETTTKRKGRPAKDPTDTQSTLCTINDPLMEPFYVEKDSSNFTVMERFTTTRGFAGTVGGGKSQIKVVGHYTSFQNALNCISKKKFYQNTGEYNSIKEYIEVWDEVKTGLNNLLSKIEI